MSQPRLALMVVAALMGSGALACRLETQTPPIAEPMAPDFQLPAHDGAQVTLGKLIEEGPAILVFYRGHW
ncbi:MAG: hypothetical protein AAF799_38600 [Myxococcota bacterium]